MDALLENTIIIATIFIPWIQAVVNMIKPFISDTRLYAPISVLVGIIMLLLIGVGFGQSLSEYLLAGFVAGLSASGLYDITKIGSDKFGTKL